MRKIFCLVFAVFCLSTLIVSSSALSGSNEVLPYIQPVVSWDLQYIYPFTSTIQGISNYVGSAGVSSGSGVLTGLDADVASGGPGLYDVVSKRYNSTTTSNPGGVIALTVSNVMYNKQFNFLPCIYIPLGEDARYNLWYGADPVAYVSLTVRNLATDVRQSYTDVHLISLMDYRDTEGYYCIADALRDGSLPEDLRDALYNNTLLIERMTVQLYVVANPYGAGVNGDPVHIRHVASLPYTNDQGVLVDPLRPYYDNIVGALAQQANANGYDTGYYYGYQDGENVGIAKGEEIGYSRGYSDGATNGFDFTSFLRSSLAGLFDLRFGPISLGIVLSTIIAVLLVFWLLKLIGGG